ncbi:anthranilate synthase component I family protein [Luethyella okanaganae]|uniref:Anthranilate synthase component I family protein n=1 Tax=Luethyella okanaganae TaxID=69372 RepID=A0ABW1VCL2_9MICO
MTGQIRSVLLDGWWDPAFVFTALYAREAYAFWLDGGTNAKNGMSYLGAALAGRVVTASVDDGTVTVARPGDPAGNVEPATIFEFLREDLAAIPIDDPGGTGGFRLGWVGWLGYELAAQTTGTPVHEACTPDAAFMFADRAIAFDHRAGTVTLLALERGTDASGATEAWARAVRERLGDAGAAGRDGRGDDGCASVTDERTPPTARWRHSPEHYETLVLACQDAIRRGDAYQLCLTNEIEVDSSPDPLDAYLRLRSSSPTHHGGLLRFGGVSLLSASPEQFLKVTADGLVTTKPIKGTRARAAGSARDRQVRAELEASDKERAENLMIVDLMRNDLGRVAALGSVTVSELLAVESYAHVHQLVSTIQARLAHGLTGVDAVEACFPAGSMTGAPKFSAMTILDGLEGGPRGVYAGAFGYFGLDGAVDLAMVIRSIVLDRDGARIGTGGGITALSVPVEEIEETRVKARALLAVLGVVDR